MRDGRRYYGVGWLKSRLRSTRLYPKLLQLEKIPFYTGRASRPHASAGKFCVSPWTESAILCDGTVVCSCYDALGTMPLGNVTDSSFESVWRGKRYRRLRKAVLAGAENVYLCSSCCFQCPRPSAETLEREFALEPECLPKRLHVEPTVRCNLRCTACCTALAKHARNVPDMPYDTFCRIMDEMAPHLEQLNLYDYGESFIHPRATDMIRYAKSLKPGLKVACSTNGHFFQTPESQRAIVSSGADEIIFSLDGASQETYGKYRIGGRFEVVVDAMKALVAMKRELGLDKPAVIWRYILFNWNDSDEEMDRARALAREIGVDDLCWLLTDMPADGYSTRFVPGSPDLDRIKHELHADCRYPQESG